MTMSIKALGDYDFPAKDRQEVYGDDQLVNVFWEGNMLFCAAACFRAPRAMPWGDFKAKMIDPWASADPDYRPDAAVKWHKDDKPFAPKPEQTLAELGIPHKGLVKFRTG
jgi:phenol hydroxylase P4 protein